MRSVRGWKPFYERLREWSDLPRPPICLHVSHQTLRTRSDVVRQVISVLSPCLSSHHLPCPDNRGLECRVLWKSKWRLELQRPARGERSGNPARLTDVTSAPLRSGRPLAWREWRDDDRLDLVQRGGFTREITNHGSLRCDVIIKKRENQEKKQVT